MFSGDKLLQRAEILERDPSHFKQRISQPTIDGYLFGMADGMLMSML
jgi:hypothetical protein